MPLPTALVAFAFASRTLAPREACGCSELGRRLGVDIFRFRNLIVGNSLLSLH